MAPLFPMVCTQLSASVIEVLRKNGICTVDGFLAANMDLLSTRTGLTSKLLRSIHRSLVEQFAASAVSAADILQELHGSAALLPTGCSSLDNLLDGGLLTGEVVEITGPPSSGKTQLCLSLSAAVAATTCSTVVAVATGASFTASRLQDLLPLDNTEEVLSKVRVYQVFDVFQLLTLLETLSQQMAQQTDCFHSNLHLVVVDSITMLLSPLLGGHPQGHALLVQVASSFHRLAHDHMAAVVYTNNMVSDVTSGSLRPALGQTWAHLPNTRISLAILDSGQRTATLTASTRQPTGIASTFHISGSGLIQD